MHALNKANIVYWFLIKCKKVTKNILALKLYGIVYSFNIGTVIKFTLDKVLQVNLPFFLCTNLKFLYNYFV